MAEQKRISKAEQRRTARAAKQARQRRQRELARWLDTTNPVTGREKGRA